MELFVKESNGRVSITDLKDNVYIRFTNYPKGSNIIGTCYYKYYGKNYITINIEWWNRLSTAHLEKLTLIFHELGHCYLYRKHTEIYKEEDIDGFWSWLDNILFEMGLYIPKGYLEDGCPYSMMHPYSIGYWCMNRHYKHYMKELFEEM
jgi:hypothetical protein